MQITDLQNVITVKMRSRSIDTIDIIQHKNIISSLNRLIIEKSKKIVHLEKEERLWNKSVIGQLLVSIH